MSNETQNYGTDPEVTRHLQRIVQRAVAASSARDEQVEDAFGELVLPGLTDQLLEAVDVAFDIPAPQRTYARIRRECLMPVPADLEASFREVVENFPGVRTEADLERAAAEAAMRATDAEV